jgi:hypothetical protein
VLGDGGSVTDLAVYMGHHDPAVTLRIYGHMHQGSDDRARQIIDRRMFRPRAVSGGDAAAELSRNCDGTGAHSGAGEYPQRG